ncbi:AraC family transcriptional regulator [Mesorhizobium sp. BR1-1-16]|uniref:AraC family transcriptional regulator n=1 Tax=Mesorhizobium sp. BR1-1-16 TaxID=2876653 RepID=UPI001CC93E38|nr:AraC family transcriptional regulator [Mesorhizobium sp. BR1-1-16]MBZ9937594.1 AraC family transcriptional regulator [Mesorhizobium sp. BR1-1-16]
MNQLEELRDILRRRAVLGRAETAIPRLRLIRAEAATLPAPSFYEPVLCIAVQGSKRLMVGEQAVVYDPSRFLLVAVDLPVMACIVDATPATPYLCATLRLDRLAIIEMLAGLPAAAEGADQGVGMAIGPLEADLLDPVLRLVRLVEQPGDAAVLAPLAEREILYRLLTGPAGVVLRQMVAQNSRLARVDRAIDWIKSHFNQPMRIDSLAEIAGMSPASLHRHFKAVTAMSPLQFQKQIRLIEARRRLVAENLDAGMIAFSVGYESQSQFSREYARLFGAPPSRDAARLRGLAAVDPERIGAPV